MGFGLEKRQAVRLSMAPPPEEQTDRRVCPPRGSLILMRVIYTWEVVVCWSSGRSRLEEVRTGVPGGHLHPTLPVGDTLYCGRKMAFTRS